MDTGRIDYPRAGFARGNYWIESASGLRNGPRFPAKATRADQRERFRYMLANDLSMGRAAASALIERIDACTPEVA